MPSPIVNEECAVFIDSVRLHKWLLPLAFWLMEDEGFLCAGKEGWISYCCLFCSSHPSQSIKGDHLWMCTAVDESSKVSIVKIKEVEMSSFSR